MLKYLVVISFYLMVSNSLFEYGEFDVKVTKFETVKGPKRKNCAEVETRIVKGIFMDIDLNMKEDMKTIKGNIIGSLNDKELVRLRLKNLCDHIFFGPMLKSLFNNSDHCAIEKGRFHLNLNLQTMTRNLYGGKFMYGDWKFKWIFHNEFCNFLCGLTYLSVTPKEFAVGDK